MDWAPWLASERVCPADRGAEEAHERITASWRSLTVAHNAWRQGQLCRLRPCVDAALVESTQALALAHGYYFKQPKREMLEGDVYCALYGEVARSALVKARQEAFLACPSGTLRFSDERAARSSLASAAEVVALVESFVRI